MDEEIREDQLDDDRDEANVEGHAMHKYANPEEDEDEGRSALKK